MVPRSVSRADVADRLAEFKRDLLQKRAATVASECILDGDPFIFSDERAAYTSLVSELSENLSIAQGSIVAVGSAKLGFSVHPDKFPRPFGPNSDIDMAVIDHLLFDRIWHAIIDWHYPRKSETLPPAEQEWVRQRRRDIYWGLFHPDKIRFRGLTFPQSLVPLRNISTSWFNAFRKASLATGLTAHTVSGRLYRSREHAMKYQAAGLRRIRATLAQ